MAADDTVLPPDDTATDSGSGSWFQSHKPAVIGGGLVLLVVGFVFLRKKSSSSSTTSTGSSSTGPAVYEVAPGYLQGGTGGYTGGSSDTGYSSLIALEQYLASQAQTGNTGSQGPSGVTPTSGTAASSSTATSTTPLYPNPAPPFTQPTVTASAPPAPSGPTYTHISSPADAGVLAADNQTEYGLVAGQYIPVVQNGTWTAAGQAYRNEPNTGLYSLN